MGKSIKTDIQIRFADVDILAHVNNVNIQHYFDLGKSDFYDKTLGDEIDWKGNGIILVSVKTDVYAQTRMKDKMYVETRVLKIGTKSMTLLQRLVNHATSACHAECRTVMVGFNFASQCSIVLPDKWRKVFSEYLIDATTEPTK